MKMEMNILIEILEKSIEKNGPIPLTTQHLLNILRMAERVSEDADPFDSGYENLDWEWK
jgi:hypothetical protein